MLENTSDFVTAIYCGDTLRFVDASEYIYRCPCELHVSTAIFIVIWYNRARNKKLLVAREEERLIHREQLRRSRASTLFVLFIPLIPLHPHGEALSFSSGVSTIFSFFTLLRHLPMYAFVFFQSRALETSRISVFLPRSSIIKDKQ